jgi:hypothetical protein
VKFAARSRQRSSRSAFVLGGVAPHIIPQCRDASAASSVLRHPSPAISSARISNPLQHIDVIGVFVIGRCRAGCVSFCGTFLSLLTS